jgi:hypothetical protein
MLYKTLNFIYEMVAVKQYLIFSASFFALSAMVMLMTDNLVRPHGCPGAIPLQFAFTKSVFSDIVALCGAAGVRAHIILEWIDYIFIFAYTGFLMNLLGSLVRGLERKRALTFFSLPLIAGLLDLIENTLILNQLSNPETLSETVILAASTAAFVKFVLIGLTLILILHYLYKAAVKKSHAS